MTVNGTMCYASQSNYDTWEACRSNIQCGENQYLYGNSCASCQNGSQIANTGCQGNADTCCRKTCYNFSNNECSEVTVNGTMCYNSESNYDSLEVCQSNIQGQDEPTTCLVNNCATCATGSTTTCAVCKYGYYLSNESSCKEVSSTCCISGNTVTNNIDACKSAAYQNPSTFSPGSCPTCSVNNCTTCAAGSTTTCAVCEYGYYLSEGICKSISSITAPCCIDGSTVRDTSTCQQVASNSPLSFAAGACSTTTPTCTVENCTRCENGNATKCQKCNNGYSLSNGTCVATTGPCCVTNSSGLGVTHEDDSACLQASLRGSNVLDGTCPTNSIYSCTVPNCSACGYNSPSVCSSCSTGYKLSEGTCIAIETGTTCSIKSVSTNSKSTSVSSNDNDENSYYIVNVELSGDACIGKTLKYEAENGNAVPTSSTVISDSTSRYMFKVYPSAASCSEKSYAIVQLLDGSNVIDRGQTTDVVIIYDWSPESSNYCEDNPQYTSFLEADRVGASFYFSDYDATCTNLHGGKGGYTRKWVRGCNSGSALAEPEYCFAKYGNGTANSYCYGTQSHCSGYSIKVDNNPCNETPACYQNVSTNVYEFGMFSNQTNYYKYIGATCPTSVVENKACYLKRGNESNNDYCFNTASICTSQGFTETVYGRVEADCGENPQCYRKVVGSEYIYSYGLYSGQSDYEPFGDTCPKPACYKDSSNHYYWTSSPKDDDIEITSINKPEDCADDGKCYYDEVGREYHWTNNPDSSWTEVESKNGGPTECRDDEDPACYLNIKTGEYDWGLHSNVIGWRLVSEINVDDNCVRPNAACYVDNVGDYYWGNFENNQLYSLVVGVPEKECNVPVPKTALDRFKVIYIAVSLFAIAGVGMVVYVKKKKENQRTVN